VPEGGAGSYHVPVVSVRAAAVPMVFWAGGLVCVVMMGRWLVLRDGVACIATVVI